MAPISFPPDLIQLQAAWQRTYEALAARHPHPRHTTALRRRLQQLSARLLWHPYWTAAGRSPTAVAELRRQARALGPGRTR